MALGNRQDFPMHSGDTVTLVITVSDEAGIAIDITDAAQFRWALGRLATGGSRPAPASPGNPLFTKSLGSGVTIVSGAAEVALASGDTAALAADEYYHEAELILSGARSTVMYGKVDLAGDLIE